MVATAAAGPAIAIALLATLDSPSALAALLHIAAAALSLSIGLLAIIRLQRAALLERSRGRSITRGTGAAEAGSALRVALATTVLVLLVSAVIEIIALGTTAGTDGDGSPGSQALLDARARRDAESAAPLETDGSALRPRVVGPMPGGGRGGSSGGGPVGDLLSGAEVLRIRPVDDPSRERLTGAPLHLRGFVIDTYDGNGRLRERRGQRIRLGADEHRWIDIRELAGAAVQGDSLDLEVAFVGVTNGLVFAPTRLMSVQPALATGPFPGSSGSALEHDAAQETLWLDENQAHRYRVRSTIPAVGLDDLRAAPARGSIPESDGLPAQSTSARRNAIRTLRGYAAALTNGLDTDVDRVLAVVRHLRKEFSYQIYDTRFLSPEEALPFLDRSAGSCTHFASLATLLLRLEGIPTRLAAGYVAREVDFETGEWIVRERDGHVWIEVHFEGFGWLPFDPTPGDPEVGGTQISWSPLVDEARLDAEYVRRSPARTSPLGSVLVNVIGRAFEALGRFVTGAQSPAVYAMGAALGVLGFVMFLGRARRRRALPGDTEDERLSVAGPQQPSSGVAVLLRAVRSRGWTQGRTTTPSSFAKDLEASHPEATGVSQAFRSALRSACTGQGLASEEEQQLLAVSQRIRAGPEAPNS